MQKVVGSSPIIRSKTPGKRGFLVSRAATRTDAHSVELESADAPRARLVWLNHAGAPQPPPVEALREQLFERQAELRERRPVYF